MQCKMARRARKRKADVAGLAVTAKRRLAEELAATRQLLTFLENQLEQESGPELSAQWRGLGRTGLQHGASLLATSLQALRHMVVGL